MPNACVAALLIVACTLMTTVGGACADAAHRPRRGSRRARSDARAQLRRPHRVRRRCATSCSTSTRSSTSCRSSPTSYEWSADSKALTIKLRPDVTFHDGEKLDAAAVKYSLERHKTMAGSNRRGELAPVASVDVVDPTTVRLNLSAPFSPLLAQLADRAGMIVSPKAAQAAGDKFGAKPVCAGPFKFVERVAQDRIVLERYPNYWNKADDPFRPGRLPADPRLDGAPRQPALGPARLHRAPRAVRRAAGRRATRASRSRRSPRSATRASRSTSARATSRRRIRSAAIRACARRSSWRSTATASCRWRWTARRRRQPVGRADQPVLREERADARRATSRARRRCCKEAGVPNPIVHADDADDRRTRSASRRSCRRWRAKPAST